MNKMYEQYKKRPTARRYVDFKFGRFSTALSVLLLATLIGVIAWSGSTTQRVDAIEAKEQYGNDIEFKPCPPSLICLYATDGIIWVCTNDNSKVYQCTNFTWQLLDVTFGATGATGGTGAGATGATGGGTTGSTGASGGGATGSTGGTGVSGATGSTGGTGVSGGTGLTGTSGTTGSSGADGTGTSAPSTDTATVQFVAVGSDGGSGTTSTLVSYNGTRWFTLSTNPLGTGGIGAAVGFSPELQQWLVGGYPGTFALAYSYNGLNYTGISSFGLTNVTAVAWSSDQRRWVAGGSGGAFMYWSNNGTNWTASLNANSIFTGGVTAIIYNPRYAVWMSSGYGTNTLAWSPDGSNWTAVVSSPITTRANALCASWGSYNMLAVGAGTNTVALSQVAYSIFVGGGTPVFPTSPNALACAYGASGMFVMGGNSTGADTNVGNITILGSTTNDAGLIVATRYVVGTTGILVNMSIYIQTAAGNMIMGVYTDTGNGYPGTLLATSATIALSSTGWITVAPTDPAVAISSFAVWIVHIFSSSSVAVAYSNAGGSSTSYSYTFGALPLTWQPVTTGLSVNSYSQYITMTTMSNLAYTTDGLNFYSIGSRPFMGTVNSIVYSPSLGIWVAGGGSSAQVGYSYSGSSLWVAGVVSGSTLTTVSAVASYYTTLLSPSSLQGVMALSGTGPLTPADRQIRFVFGGNQGGAVNTGRGLGFTIDNINVNTFLPSAPAGTAAQGYVRALAYSPQLNVWTFTRATAAAPTWVIYWTSGSILSPSTQAISGAGMSATNMWLTWSSSQSAFLATNNNTNGNQNCFSSTDGQNWAAAFCSTLLTSYAWVSAYSRQQNLWVVLGLGASRQIIYGSSLTTWSSVSGVYFTQPNTVTWAPSIPLWIIGGSNASGSTTIVITPHPGVIAPYPAATQPFGTSGGSCNGCNYGNGVIVCAGTPGTGSTNTLAYSTDGNNWIGLGNSIFSTKGNHAAYDYVTQTWMAVGSGTNTVAKSIDNGVTWTALSYRSSALTNVVVVAVQDTPQTTQTRDTIQDMEYMEAMKKRSLLTEYVRNFTVLFN